MQLQKIMSKKITRIILISLVIMIFISAVYALTAANTVPESGADQDSEAITANQVKPSDCDSLNLVNIITDGNGTTSNDLLLGSSGSDSMTGSDGSDCLVAGDGDDSLDGGAGSDICIGGAGSDTFIDCETQIDP